MQRLLKQDGDVQLADRCRVDLERGEVIAFDLQNQNSMASDTTEVQYQMNLIRRPEAKTCTAKLKKRFDFDSLKHLTSGSGGMPSGGIDHSTYLQTILSQTTRGFGERPSTISKGPTSTTMSNQ